MLPASATNTGLQSPEVKLDAAAYVRKIQPWKNLKPRNDIATSPKEVQHEFKEGDLFLSAGSS
jgi:hypothetical protein